MKAFESAYDALVHEFSSGTIDILISDHATVLLDHPDDVEGYYNYSFEIQFNEDFRSFGSNLPQKNIEYQEFIDKKRLELYDEINEIIDREEINAVNTKLNDYRFKFAELKNFYTKTQYSRYQEKFIILGHNRYKKIRSHNSRPIIELNESLTSSTYFSVQLEAIDMIVSFLDNKTEFVKEFMVEDFDNEVKVKRKLNAIESLDRFQSALLFHYLEDVEAIKDLRSYKKLAYHIQELTDHSQNTLSKECLNNIQDIKMGKAGNKLEILKNKTYNLQKVRIVLRKMINALERDLKNNKESQKSNPL